MTLENLDKMIGSLWTNSAIKDCYKNLEENKDADAYETLAGRLCSLDEKHEYQVKVIVTRKEHTSVMPQFPKDREVIGDTCLSGNIIIEMGDDDNINEVLEEHGIRNHEEIMVKDERGEEIEPVLET